MVDAPLPRRRVAKKTTIDKYPPSNSGNRNSSTAQRARRTATPDAYDDMAEYTPSGRQSSQSALPMSNNEVWLFQWPSKIIRFPLSLPSIWTGNRAQSNPWSATAAHLQRQGATWTSHGSASNRLLICASTTNDVFLGNPESIMNELIREAADFYMNVYPQLTHGVEYKKIGIALINEYPCLACEDTINPHVGWASDERDGSAFSFLLLSRVWSHLDCQHVFAMFAGRCAHESKNVKSVAQFTRNRQSSCCSCIETLLLLCL